MNRDFMDRDSERLWDGYLAGELGEDERWELDRRRMLDPDLAATVEMQQRVADSVQRQFSAPDLDGLVALVSERARAKTARSVLSNRLRGLWLVLITSLLFGLAAWAGGDRLLRTETADAVIRPLRSDIGTAVVLGVASAATIAGTARLMQRRGGGGPGAATVGSGVAFA